MSPEQLKYWFSVSAASSPNHSYVTWVGTKYGQSSHTRFCMDVQFCLGHAGARDKEWADRLAFKSTSSENNHNGKGVIVNTINKHARRYKNRWGCRIKIERVWNLSVVPEGGSIRGDKSDAFINQWVTGTIRIYTLWHMLGEMEHLWVCQQCQDVGS